MQEVLTSPYIIPVYHFMIGYVYNWLSGYTNHRKEMNAKVHNEMAYRLPEHMIDAVISFVHCLLWPLLAPVDILKLIAYR